MWTNREVMYKQETAGKDNGTGVFQFPIHLIPPA